MTAPNPVLSTLRYFKHEYLEHIEHQHCRAGVCRVRQQALVGVVPSGGARHERNRNERKGGCKKHWSSTE